MRASVVNLMELLGIRRTAATGRDRLVDLLVGDQSTPLERRNNSDDRVLSLLLSFSLRPDSNCLDLGANEGMFLYPIVRVAPSGHHIAYEPVPYFAALLRRRFPGVEIRERALSNVEGERTMLHVVEQGHEGYSSLSGAFIPQEFRTEPLTVHAERLDDHLPDGWLPDFVKIDVEGEELPVLEGALETLSKARPVVAIEHGFSGDGSKSEAVYKLLCKDVGLRLFNMDGEGPLTMDGFMNGLKTRFNWVAHV
jgi:FkbM family methyltransferase